MTVVRIPPILRVETGHRRDVEVDGSTVREVLETLVETFTGLDGRVLQDGRLPSFINVYLDGVDVETYDGLDTAVDPNSTLLLLPAMAGGSSKPHAQFDAFGRSQIGPSAQTPVRLRLLADQARSRTYRDRVTQRVRVATRALSIGGNPRACDAEKHLSMALGE